MNESWLNELLRDGRVGMSKTITVRRSELGTLRMAISNERKYNKIADLAPDCEAYKSNASRQDRSEAEYPSRGCSQSESKKEG